MYSYVCFTVLVIAATCQSADVSTKSALCKYRNMYLKVDGKCDSYVECVDYHPADMQCPDGLHFNPSAQWPEYPCGYPQDVQCVGRGVSQPAIPTADCAHQYGYFTSPLAHTNDCGHYRVCIAGIAVEMYCPAGLAFNSATARCDWPDLVPTCNAEKYLGFKCPPASVDEEGKPKITNHKYAGDCYSFYSCVSGQVRVLSCDPGYAFDESTGRCENSNSVTCDVQPIPTSQ